MIYRDVTGQGALEQQAEICLLLLGHDFSVEVAGNISQFYFSDEFWLLDSHSLNMLDYVYPGNCSDITTEQTIGL